MMVPEKGTGKLFPNDLEEHAPNEREERQGASGRKAGGLLFDGVVYPSADYAYEVYKLTRGYKRDKSALN